LTALGRGRLAWLAAVCVLMVTSLAVAQSTQPVANPKQASAQAPIARGPDESRPINRSVAPTTQATGVKVPDAGLDTRQVVLSLGIVIGLILLLKWAAKRMFPGQAGIPSSRAIQVVSRSVVSPKQQFLMLQVGKRLVVVADSGAGMSPVCEITDPDEVAELIGQIRSQATQTFGKSFMTLFGRKQEQFEVTEDSGEKSALLGDGPIEDSEDPAVGMTREEIGGLMDKVRMLSRQFKRP